MSKKLIALAGIVLLSTSALAAAQSGGTTVVPAGQKAPAADQGAPGQGASGQAAAPAVAGEAQGGSGGADGGQAAAPAQSRQADAAAAGSGSGGVEMAASKAMQPDAHPSKDTATEGNAATKGEMGKYTDPAGNPTYFIADDGKVDWYTWRGYKKYMANCMQCHGPDGLGSSFAPNLTDQLTQLSYYDFAGIVVSGQKNKWNPSGNSVMPAWGDDPNVMCSLDAIYTYLRARADGVVARGEPKPHEADKEAKQAEYSCLGF